MLMTCSSDGFCSFIKIDMDVIGVPLPNDSEKIPESLKTYYKELSEVSFKKNMEVAKERSSGG